MKEDNLIIDSILELRSKGVPVNIIRDVLISRVEDMGDFSLFDKEKWSKKVLYLLFQAANKWQDAELIRWRRSNKINGLLNQPEEEYNNFWTETDPKETEKWKKFIFKL